MKGDCTGPQSTEFVLRDPTVNFAVLECARGGLLRAGLAFSKCDVGIVTNVAADHLGLKGIHTIEQLAQVKAVIPETVLPDGYAILNADDDLVYDMRKGLECNVALFSMDEDNPRIKALQRKGGITAVYENGYVTLCRGAWKMRIMKAENIPLTYGGKAKFMIQNILRAIIACNVKNITIEDNNLIGSIAAEMFDEIIIRQDKHLRGKSEEELIKMLQDGIAAKNPDIKTTVIPSEKEAIFHAVKNIPEGGLIILCSDVVTDALELVEDLKEQEQKGASLIEKR